MHYEPMAINDSTAAEETIAGLTGIWQLVITDIEQFDFNSAKRTLDFYMSMYCCLNNAGEAFRYYLEHRPINRKQIEKAKVLVSAYKDLMDFVYTPLLTRWRDRFENEQLLEVINAHQGAKNTVDLTIKFSRFYGSSERFSLPPAG